MAALQYTTDTLDGFSTLYIIYGCAYSVKSVVYQLHTPNICLGTIDVLFILVTAVRFATI